MLKTNQSRPQKGLDYPGVTVCCVCHDGQGNLLLNKRTKQCRDEWERWDNWGGGVEFGDTLEETILRELAEEGNITPLKIERGDQVLDVLRHAPDGRPSHWVAIPYAVLIEHRQYQSPEPEKFSEAAWFPLTNLPQPRHSFFDQDLAAVAPVLAKYQHLNPKHRQLKERSIK